MEQLHEELDNMRQLLLR